MITINGVSINTTLFPDNTSQVWKLPPSAFSEANAKITWSFVHEAEFIHLAQLKTLLDSHGIISDLYITYLPYGRQDKEVSNDTTFALRTFAQLLNSLNFSTVSILDPHSSEALKFIRNSTATIPYQEVFITELLTGSDIMCYPDSGALKKYNDKYGNATNLRHTVSLLFNQTFLRPYDYGYAQKVRDQTTGEIIKYELVEPEKFEDKTVLIVDDICDGGATFIKLASLLYNAGAKNINLFVTHGIFSKGLAPLYNAGISNIYTYKGKAYEIQGNVLYSPFLSEGKDNES